MAFRSDIAAPLLPRLKAGGTHLLASATVALVLILVVTQVWYPAPLFDLVQGRDIFFLIIGCDISLGPALTLVIFNTRKPRNELVRDIAVIACVQLIALSYGIYALSQVRPAYIVFNVARFNVTMANELLDADAKDPETASRPTAPWTGPRLVGARLPTDAKERNEMLLSALGGHGDVYQMPRYFVDYQSVKPEVIAHVKTVPEIAKMLLVEPSVVEQATESYRRRHVDIGLLPLVIRQTTGLAVVDRKTGDLLGIEQLRRPL